MEARNQLLDEIEGLVRAREAKMQASGSGNSGGVLHRNVHDYTLDDMRAMVSMILSMILRL